jgi:hypothetical protein
VQLAVDQAVYQTDKWQHQADLAAVVVVRLAASQWAAQVIRQALHHHRATRAAMPLQRIHKPREVEAVELVQPQPILQHHPLERLAVLALHLQ